MSIGLIVQNERQCELTFGNIPNLSITNTLVSFVEKIWESFAAKDSHIFPANNNYLFM